MTDDSGGNVAKKGAIGDADPLVILVPVTESSAPPPCDTAGAISCADLESFGRCDATDPKPKFIPWVFPNLNPNSILNPNSNPGPKQVRRDRP